MQGKITELIAIGASIGANCQPCLKTHLRLAREYGATEEEIKEAINVALTVRMNSTKGIDKAIEEIQGNVPNLDKPSCCSG